jgi:hypothetical protein
MRPWTSLTVLAAFALAALAGAAHAVDEGKLKNLSAPPPVTVTPLPADTRTVKFAKMVVQLKPEPWAFLRNKDTLTDDRLVSAQDGQKAIGSPLGAQFQNTMSKGIVSALRDQQGLAFIQSDVMVNHGSSGGPLLDETGRVIGLTASGQVVNEAPVGINFFIPIDEALKTLNVTAPPEPALQQAKP